MATITRLRHKPASLSVQVMLAERQVLDRRRLVNARLSTLGQTIRTQMTSPAMLLWAGGLGFAAGQITGRRASGPDDTERPRGIYSFIFGSAMKLISLVSSLSSVSPPEDHRLPYDEILD